MFRRALAILSFLCLLLLLPAVAVYVRGKFTSDIVKIYRWNPANRQYSELHIVSQGGLLSLYGSLTVLAADADSAVAEERAGPTGWNTWWYQQPPVKNNAGSWNSFEHRRRVGHAGVTNPNGTRDTWTLETRPIGWIVFLSLPPLLWLTLRKLAARKRQRRVEAGRCLDCGYDLRASTERCPECGRPIESADRIPDPAATVGSFPQ